MALSNFAELAADVRDTLVGQTIPEERMLSFVVRAEADINRLVRTPGMIRSRTAPLDSEYLTVPGDYLEAKNVTLLVGGGRQQLLEPISAMAADEMRLTHHGLPRYINVLGDRFELVPAPATDGTMSVRLDYYAAVPSLTSNPSNHVLASHPDLYLSLVLKHAWAYAKDAQEALLCHQEAARIVADINLAGARAEYGAAPLRARTRSNY